MKADKLKQTGTNQTPQQALPGIGAGRLMDFNFRWHSGSQISPSLVMGSRQQMKEKSGIIGVIHRAIHSAITFMDCGGAVITEATAGNPKLKRLEPGRPCELKAGWSLKTSLPTSYCAPLQTAPSCC